VAYSSRRKSLFLFGDGYNANKNDTWVYNPARNAWVELKPLASPPARGRHTLCYDAENDLVVLYGGGSNKKARTDTWVFDANRNSWFEIKTRTAPDPGTGQIEYDPANKCCLVWNAASGKVWALKLAPSGR